MVKPNYKLLPALTLIVACSGEIKESPSTESPQPWPQEYNLPVEILERTLTRSSRDGGFSAGEIHSYGGHKYIISAVKFPLKQQQGILAFQVSRTGTKTSTVNAYSLLDFVKTRGLDIPSENFDYGVLYSLLLGEQRDSLNGQEPDPKNLDFWLRIIDRR